MGNLMDLRAVDQQFAEFERAYNEWNSYVSASGAPTERDGFKNRITSYHANFMVKAFSLWDELCLYYASATPAECARVRQVMAKYPELVAYLFRNAMPKYHSAVFIRHPKMIISEEYLSYPLEVAFRMGLAAVSIENCHTAINPHKRSELLTELVYQTRLNGVAIEPYLAAVAERSDPSPGKNGCKPMQETLANFHQSELLKRRHTQRRGIFWIPQSKEDFREYYKDSAIGCAIGGLIIVAVIMTMYLLRRFGPVLLPGSSPDLPYIVGLVVLFGLLFGATIFALRREVPKREKPIKINITTEQSTLDNPTEQCALSISPGPQTSSLSYAYKDDSPIRLAGVPNRDFAKIQQKLEAEGWVQTMAEKSEDRGYVEKIALTFQR